MVTAQPTLALPKDLIDEIEAAAQETNLTTDALIRAAVRRFLESERRWHRLQAEGSERARAAGIYTEDDVEAFMDSLENEA